LGNRIILDYIKQTLDSFSLNLESVYIYFKFKAYLQTTLRETKKAYCIKKWKTADKITYMHPYDLCALSDSKIELKTDDSPEKIDWAMSQLKPAQAEVVKLSIFSNLTDTEISSIKRVSRQSVNAIKNRAFKRLKEILENDA